MIVNIRETNSDTLSSCTAAILPPRVFACVHAACRVFAGRAVASYTHTTRGRRYSSNSKECG